MASSFWPNNSAARSRPGFTANSAAPMSKFFSQTRCSTAYGERGHKYPVWMSHGDRVTRLPEGFKAIAQSENAPMAAIADEARRYYGVQFHLEVAHTPDGARLISNFLHKIAGLKSDWTMKAFRQEAIGAIRRQVGDGRVLCGLAVCLDDAIEREDRKIFPAIHQALCGNDPRL